MLLGKDYVMSGMARSSFIVRHRLTKDINMNGMKLDDEHSWLMSSALTKLGDRRGMREEASGEVLGVMVHVRSWHNSSGLRPSGAGARLTSLGCVRWASDE